LTRRAIIASLEPITKCLAGLDKFILLLFTETAAWKATGIFIDTLNFITCISR
jgi:hypothetical protein